MLDSIGEEDGLDFIDNKGLDVVSFPCEYNENNAPDHEAVPAFLKVNGCRSDGGFRIIPAD